VRSSPFAAREFALLSSCIPGTFTFAARLLDDNNTEEDVMGFGRGALLWLLGVPLPVIILLALFWHH
jgi:hypothetical protein